MNLKKLIMIAVLLPLLTNGCVSLPKRQVEPDIASDLWNKILEITELKDTSPMPEITLFEKDTYEESPEDCSKYNAEKLQKQCQEYNETLNNKNTLARAFLLENRIELYTEIINKQYSWLQYNHNLWLKNGVEDIYFYKTVAHEMLHHALWRKWLNENQREYRDTLEQHRLMRDKKYLESAILYLCRRFNLEPKFIIDELKMADLEYSIKSDNLIKERLTREKPDNSKHLNNK